MPQASIRASGTECNVKNAAGGVEVAEARICYGGVAPKCIMATRTQAALEGNPWTQETLDAALLAVAQDVNITPDAPGDRKETSTPLNIMTAASVPRSSTISQIAISSRTSDYPHKTVLS